MDLNLAIVVVVCVVVTFIAVYFVSVMGIKEKTFEEAIAEQKKRTDQLLGSQQGQKKKTKVKKKKKINLDSEPEIIDQSSESRRPSAIEREIKSILINKEEKSPINEDLVEVNHFEEINPKDDLELRKSFDEGHADEKEDEVKKVRAKPAREDATDAVLSGHQNKVKNEDRERKKEPVVDPAPVMTHYVEEVVEQPMRQEKKKKKEQMTYEKLEGSITKIQLSNDEVQNLIDILLNKEQTEWVNKGKPDNLSILRKQLADKEQLLMEESRTVLNLHTKIKEIRAELTMERNRSVQLKRINDEQAVKVNEIANYQIKFQQINDKCNADKVAFQREMQKLTTAMTQIQNENMGLKSALENCRKAEVVEREADALRTQLGHLENQLAAAFNSNAELTNNIRTYQESLFNEKKTIDELLSMNNSYKERETQFISELKKRDETTSSFEQVKSELNREIYMLKERVKQNEEARTEVENKFEESKKFELQSQKVLKEKNSELDDLRKAFEKKGEDGKEISKLTFERDGLIEQVKDLDMKIKSDVSRIEKLEKENKTLEEERTNLSNQMTEKASVAQNDTNEKPYLQLFEKFQKLFPNVQLSQDSWEEDLTSNVRIKLQELDQYKGVLANTECILSNLQSSIESEEVKWTSKLRDKDNQIESLKTQLADSKDVTKLDVDYNSKYDEKSLNGTESLLESTTISTNSTPPTQKTKRKKGTKK